MDSLFIAKFGITFEASKYNLKINEIFQKLKTLTSI